MSDKNGVVVSVEDVSMHFNMASEKVNSIRDYFTRLTKRQLFYKDFVAVDHVSFDVRQGEIFGIIGMNGSGKSTLLKMIAGVLKPTFGVVRTSGKIAPLIELGAGFDPELTGTENIYLNGAVLGYQKKFIDTKMDDIVGFSGIENFMDVPLKNYSSGMVSRIAFAIATAVEPDILIADEILSVGDFRFQQKCEARIRSLINNGVTVLIVSHSIEQIKSLCTRVMWLDHGRQRMIGDANFVCDQYQSE